ncbi:MAG: hypothetical protein IJV88_06605 [Ruminococcus sp.]|nr:hypothetical protein [Ruminococcus sp.]
MPYFLVSFIGLLLAIIISAGYRYPSDFNDQNRITGVSLSQRHMDYGACYSFFLRNEDGEVVFDADVRLDNEPYEIVIEGCLVDEECFEELMELIEKCDIVEYVKHHKNKSTVFQVMDETENTTTIYFADETDKFADSGDYKDELYDFFVDLAMIYKDRSVTICE